MANTQMTWQEMADWLKTEHPLPSWFTGGRTVPKTHLKNVQRGLHPFGAPVTDVEGATCGNCRFHVERHAGNTYHKCKLMPFTAGPGTDLRLKWRGCIKWEADK